MSKNLQILYMQSRLVRLASARWNMPRDQVVQRFKNNRVFQYISDLWDYFHVEGDDAILCDVGEYLEGKKAAE